MPRTFTITTRQSFGEHESEHTIYVQDDRRREEWRPSQNSIGGDGAVVQTYGPRTAAICRCDLGRMFSLDIDAGEYESCRLVTFNSRFYWLRAIRFFLVHPLRAWKENRRRPPTVLVETTTVDTGERKDMFGFIARRVITTEQRKPVAPSTDDESETRTDGWYIDIDPTIACERLPPGTRTFLSVRQLGQPREVPQFKDVGPRERGYPVDVTSAYTSTATLADGTPKVFTTTSRTWVTHLSTDALDPSLFEVPGSFRKKPR